MNPGNYLHSDNPRIPRAEHPFRHSLRIQTRFSDADILGHINNNTYLQYLDLGKARFFEAALGPLFDFRSITVVIANINVDFHEQAFLTEPLDVWTRIISIGEKSLTLEQRVADADNGGIKCRATTVMVSIDTATGHATPLRPEWIRALEDFEGRPLL